MHDTSYLVTTYWEGSYLLRHKWRQCFNCSSVRHLLYLHLITVSIEKASSKGRFIQRML